MVSYQVAHLRARKTLLPKACSQADETCKGRLEVALRKDAPPGMLRVDGESGCRYYSGDNSLSGYMWLCRSHHSRYDNPPGRVVPREVSVKAGQATAATHKASGYFQSPAWREISARAGRSGSIEKKTAANRLSNGKARCQRWQINRGLPCICGKHEKEAAR